jgi:glycosyltransferase involved in cell wall biosynthesis
MALHTIRQLWPLVRERVPAARLLLAGHGLPREKASAGIEMCGRVDEAVEILGQAGVVVFPCPPTSGPKMKVLEALSYGLPVVTTEAGAEGIWGASRVHPVVVPSDAASFAAAVAGLLTDADRRLELGQAGRKLILAAHAPLPAAKARMAALQSLAM